MDRIPPLLGLFEASPLPLDIRAYTLEEWRAASERADALCLLVKSEGIDLVPA